MQKTILEPYNRLWPDHYRELSLALWAAVRDVALGIEHVGSTAVPGLVSKPIIDIDVIVEHDAGIAGAIQSLESFGYVHLGDKGIKGAEAFQQKPGLFLHNVVICTKDSPVLWNHLTIRNYLRHHPEEVKKYSAIKTRLVDEFSGDNEAYIEGKTQFLTGILLQSVQEQNDVQKIKSANIRRTKK